VVTNRIVKTKNINITELMQYRITPENIETQKAFNSVITQLDQLIQKDFTKIDVPLLVPTLVPESQLTAFSTEKIWFDERERLHLIPHSEHLLKRLVPTLGSVYSINKCFRNAEQHTSKHSIEFTMLELYKTNSTIKELVEESMNWFAHIVQERLGTSIITYQNKTIDLTQLEWISVSDAFNMHANISNICDEHQFLEQATNLGYNTKGFSYVDIFSQIYTDKVEQNLGHNGKPTVLYDYPPQMAATAKINPTTGYAERVEIYICGVELANGGTASGAEKSWDEIEQRFQLETEKIQAKKDSYNVDNGFVTVLKNLPETSGLSYGLDRMAMVLFNLNSIEDLQVISIN
jgi:elongation factor P--(R)-beta-lysine ligase